MIMEATARHNILNSIIYKRKKWLPLSVLDRRKSLYQAVSAHLPTGNSAGTAYLHCIKDGTNIDPACGSGGFLLHAMEWCYPADDNEKRDLRKHKYASKYLWGIDFEARAAKTSRALMLIAGDGHTNIFGPDVSSLDPKTWYESASGQALMYGLRQAKLTAVKIPENETLKDEDKAWEYFDELKFDVIFANPPFAGEMKDRKMLVHYDLAKPALKRAGEDKAPKEERDVLFIERILKMLRPGGRAAIVLPQGKFNNSSLAFIREWILKKARLLAVVGLHPNTFKPHTGTKTSVLFVQKYTEKQLADIARVHDKVAKDCPKYDKIIQDLFDEHDGEVPEDAIPEAIADLLTETFREMETEKSTEENGDTQNSDEEANEPISDEERIVWAEEKVESLKTELIRVKQKLIDLDSELEAMEQQHQFDLEAIKARHLKEIENISSKWTGTKTALNKELKPIKEDHRSEIKTCQDEYKERVKETKAQHKTKKKNLNDALKRLEKEIPNAERDLKFLTNRGKLELILADADLIGTLKERWIAAEVAKRLDYPIFMAVSERGGKNNSGDYEYVLDEDGHLVEDASGQPKVEQDLVNYDLTADDLADAASIPDEMLCIAEAFVRFAQEQGFDFWRVD
jgi:type I restriction enzyme M protein